MTLNLFSMIGIVLLIGLVTKNSILLIDYATSCAPRARRPSTRSATPRRSGCGPS